MNITEKILEWFDIFVMEFGNKRKTITRFVNILLNNDTVTSRSKIIKVKKLEGMIG